MKVQTVYSKYHSTLKTLNLGSEKVSIISKRLKRAGKIRTTCKERVEYIELGPNFNTVKDHTKLAQV
jgi:hypothetical protein